MQHGGNWKAVFAVLEPDAVTTFADGSMQVSCDEDDVKAVKEAEN